MYDDIYHNTYIISINLSTIKRGKENSYNNNNIILQITKIVLISINENIQHSFNRLLMTFKDCCST